VKKVNKKIIYVHFKASHAALNSFFSKPPRNIKFLFDSINSINSFKKDKRNKDVNNRKTNSTIKKLLNHLRIFYQKVFDFFKLPRIIPVLPTKRFQYDYILTDCLVLSHKKFICMIEYIGYLVGFKDEKLKFKISRIILKKFLLSNRCKYIFLWSKTSKNMLLNFLNVPENKRNKFKTIYPSMKPKKKLKEKMNELSCYLFQV